MPEFEEMQLTDAYNDVLVVAISGNCVSLEALEAESPISFLFRLDNEDQRDAIESLRDALNDVLDDTRPPVEPDLEDPEGSNLIMLRFASQFGHPVAFRYAKGNGNMIEERVLVPHSITEAGDNLLAVGYDPDREEPRAYRLDRIKGRVRIT